MRLQTAAASLLLASSTQNYSVHGFSNNGSSSSIARGRTNTVESSGRSELKVSAVETTVEGLTASSIKKGLKFRELQGACASLGLESSGSTARLKARLLEAIGDASVESTGDVGVMDDEVCDTEEVQNSVLSGVSFSDTSDKDFDKKDLVKTIHGKVELGHWKSATRKLKQLQNKYLTCEELAQDENIHEIYREVLGVCAKDRLHGARASEPARKIIEIMADSGMPLSGTVVNECISNCIGFGPGGTHDGFGGIDPALAMLQAVESVTEMSTDGVTTLATLETYSKVLEALCSEGVIDEALVMLRAMIVEHSFTPSLTTLAAVSAAAVKAEKNEEVIQVMTLAKAAGYELDSIASADGGRSLLADGVIVAERMGNLALGLRLLTAAQKAEGCLPDRGDDLVASSSAAAQRASTLIHRRAIHEATLSDNWNLAVRILELMPKRSLTPATSCWREVVTVCAKNQKSRKATALLLDWVALSEEDKVLKPPLKVFNTVMNVCENCGEEELTLTVLESMKKTHNVDGNIITFNIALKRLAKLGNTIGCEGIIIGMLKEGIEPSIVSYTTAIAACVNANNPALAMEWLNRIRSRGKQPNIITYNTALAACLDGKFESTKFGSQIAHQMITDINNMVKSGNPDSLDLVPDTYSKKLVLSLNKQLRDNWRAGDIDMKVAKSTLRVPLMQVVDFNRSEAGKKVLDSGEMSLIEYDDDGSIIGRATVDAEENIEFESVRQLQKARAEV